MQLNPPRLVGSDEAEIEGRDRGFHDYQPTFRTAFFTPSCNYVVFGFDGKTWIVDVEAKRTGLIAVGTPGFILPESVSH